MLKGILQKMSFKQVPKTLKKLALVGILLLAIVLVFQSVGVWVQYQASLLPETEISYTDFEELAVARKLKQDIYLKRVNIGVAEKLFLVFETKDGKKYKAANQYQFFTEIQGQTLRGLGYKTWEATTFQWGWVLSQNLTIFSATLGGIVGMLIFVWFISRGASAIGEEYTAYRSQKLVGPKVSFADVAGVDEAKKEMAEVVGFFGKDIERFNFFKVRFPRGVLLCGPPGTGKTLLARAASYEAKVPTFPISGSEFHKMFVGVGAARAESIFNVAIDNAPSMILIDEADSAAQSRSRMSPFESGERGSLVNRLLSLMDRLEKENIPVLVVLITNFPEALDPALLRPGRVDRHIIVPMPTFDGRKAILQVHFTRPQPRPLAPNIDIDLIAGQTVGFSGAKLATLANEAAINAARRLGSREIVQQDFTQALQRVLMGQERKLPLTEEALKRIASHEAGHALAVVLCPETDPLQIVSIIPRGESLGYTWHPPEQDSFCVSDVHLHSDIKISLAGQVAEKLRHGQVSTGAENDIKKATAVARNMVYIYGMSDLGPICLNPFDPHLESFREPWSPEIRAAADHEVLGILKESREQIEEVLSQNKDKLEVLAKLLFERGKEGKELSGKEVVEICKVP